MLVYQAVSTTGDDAAAPAGASGYGYRVPDEAAAEAVEVVVYEDFICPACRAFEGGAGAWLAEQRGAGEIVVDYRPIAFLDPQSTTEYSTRAANAAACVADDAGLDAFVAVHDALFAEQPPEGGPGLDDTRLTELATAAGAADDVVTGTPTVLVDGEPVQPTQAALEQAVAAATAA